MSSDLALPARADTVRRVLLAGMAVAVADMTFAVVVWVGVLRIATVQRVFQSVASGLLGRDAFRGGWATAALGLALHTVVAFGWTVLFLVAMRRWHRLRGWLRSARGVVLVGLAYGALAWLAMDAVVLPLSRARVTPPTSFWFWLQLSAHPFLVGLPIATLVGRGAGRPGGYRGSANASSARPSGWRRSLRTR